MLPPVAVLTECKPGHRHQEFLSLLRSLDGCVLAELDVHLIADNYATHTHPKSARLAGPTTPLSHALHPHLLILVEPGRTVVRSDYAAGDLAGLVQQRERFGGEKSTSLFSTTTALIGPLSGRLRRIQSCRKSPDFVRVFPGHNTSKCRPATGVNSNPI